MSEPVTELVQAPLVAGIDLSSDEYKGIWHKFCSTIVSLPGCRSLYWGRRVEDKDIVHMAIDWDNLAAHNDFMASPSYGPFLQNVAPLLAGQPIIFHIALPESTPFSSVGSAPVTEVLNLYFQKSYEKKDYDGNFKKFRDSALEHVHEGQAVVGAWALEEVKHEAKWNAEEFGEEGPSFTAFISWPTVQAHMEFRETEVFKTIIPPLRDGPKSVEVYHVEYQKF